MLVVCQVGMGDLCLLMNSYSPLTNAPVAQGAVEYCRRFPSHVHTDSGIGNADAVHRHGAPRAFGNTCQGYCCALKVSFALDGDVGL